MTTPTARCYGVVVSVAKKALILFAKVPEPGQVKTRLLPDLSPEQAGRVYRAFILDTLNATAGLKGVKRILACDPTRLDPFFKELADRFDLVLIDQTGEDLGARMRNALAEACRLGFDPAVLVGMDLPTLPTGYIQEAFRQFRKRPDGPSVVLGPSADGGYYLIGCSGPVPPIFDGIAWGTERVLEQTLARIADRRLIAALLPFWYDVDTLQDIRFLAQHLKYLERKAGRPVARETARVLKTLKLDGL
ncbi:MAG TPA: TIGR04282 family arsenosugar biosynthesis glycosyltransferase [Nitrospiria bacterium]|nr:TIGR04282 family arsenosugar biosynthesis glycosyltransferase [Nitrospiria bacterium]